MSNQKVKPSAAELVLLKALWAKAPLSARELHEACERDLDWSFSSTRKTLERMLDKDFAKYEKVHGVKVYRAQIGKVETLAGIAKDFMVRVLEHKGPFPAAAFFDSQILSEREIEELEALINSNGEGEE